MVLPALFASLLAISVDGFARVETRGTTGTAEVSTVPASTTAQTQVDAAVGTEFSTAAFHFQLRYAPRAVFNLTAQEGTPASDVLHTGTGVVDWFPSPLDRLRLTENFSYGDQNFSTIIPPPLGGKPGATPAPVDPQLARLAVLAYIASDTTLSYDRRLASTLKLELHSTYLMGGGADEIGRTALPLQHGVTSGATLGWKASARDDFSFSVDTNFTRVAGQDSALVNGNLGWRTRLTPLTQADLSVGGGAGGNKTPTGWDWTPTLLLGAGINRNVPLEHQDLNAGLRASLTSTIDRFGGGVYQNADISALLSYSPIKDLRMGTAAGVSRAVTGDATKGATVVHGEVNLSVNILPQLTFSVGARGERDQGPDAIQPRQTGTQWAAFASLVAADRGAF